MEALALAVTRNIPARWRFSSTRLLLIDEAPADGALGTLWYENGGYEVGPALHIHSSATGDWVFCIERVVGSTQWFMGAFHDVDHYNFGKLAGTLPAQVRDAFIAVIITQILGVLLPVGATAPDVLHSIRFGPAPAMPPVVLDGGGYGR